MKRWSVRVERVIREEITFEVRAKTDGEAELVAAEVIRLHAPPIPAFQFGSSTRTVESETITTKTTGRDPEADAATNDAVRDLLGLRGDGGER